jgi:hypothetical protein
MEQSERHPKSTLIFVYNADSGVFNALTDVAHKVFSPQTYPCNLCAITHSTLGMRKEWKLFLDSLDRPLEFLHADELKIRYGMADIILPIIFEKEGEEMEMLVNAELINTCRTINDLKQLIISRLRLTKGSFEQG